MLRLGFFAASPMHYQAPLYRRLSAVPGVDFTAIFASSGGVRPHDAGYGQPITWDIDALAGYRSVFLRKADRTPIDGSFLALADLDIVRRVHSGRFDVLVIHGYNYFTHLLAAGTQRLTRGALVFREEQTLLHPRPVWKETLKRPALRLLFSHAMGAYIGSENRSWFARYGISTERLFFSPYCVDNERFRGQARALKGRKLELQREFGLQADDRPLVVTVARLIPRKQPGFL